MATRNNVNPEPPADVTPGSGVTPAATPDVTPAATPDVTPTATPDVAPTATPDVAPTATPDLELVSAGVEEIKPNGDPRRMVKIKLHMDKKKGKGLYVNVNDHRYFIPRGEVVEVPYYIAAVINNSAKQDEETAKLIEQYGESADF